MENLLKKYALENAVKFKGKANPSAVIGSILKEDPSLKENIQTLQKKVQEVIKKVNSMKLVEQKKELEKIAPELLEKKKKEKKSMFDSFKPTTKKVVTAFPPEPSKYPHIGHAKALLINYGYAKEFGGKFILRFEDTNPELAKEEFYKRIMEDFAWLGVIPDKIDYASDYMKTYYESAEKLINLGKAYVCTCDLDAVKESRMKGKACDCRYKHFQESLIMWKHMPKMKPGTAILRLRIDLKHKNSTMRDPTIFRIMDTPHCRIGDKYKVWPNYDFENSVMDGLEGVTHRFRSKEFEMRNELQRYIQKLLGFEETNIYEFARFNLKGVVSSGRVIREMINKKELLSWDDPSLTTIIALKRRGFMPEAIKKFVLSTGITKSEATLTWDDLIIHNKRLLDAKCNRYFFIKDPVRVRIQDAPNMEVKLKLHPEHGERGFRKHKTDELFYLTEEDIKKMKDKKIYRLMDCLNFTKKNGYFIFVDTDLETYREKGDKILHWLPFKNNTYVKVEVLMPDKTKAKGIAEVEVKKMKEGTIIQFERFGFCKLEEKPNGKAKFIFTHK